MTIRMNRTTLSTLHVAALLGVGVILAACGEDTKATADDDGGAGGAVGAGGRGSGGRPGTGGVATTGGRSGTGGASTGGAANTGGTPSTGGAANTGGTPGTGGAANTGGTPSTGGTPGTGGSSTDAGAGGAVGDASTPDATTDASTVLTCGSPPYTRLWIRASTLLDHPTGPITISGNACPGTTLTLLPGNAAPGTVGPSSAFMDVTDKTPMHIRATQAGSFPLLSVEFTPDSDNLAVRAFGYSMVNAGMIANDSDAGFASLDPLWDPGTRAMIALQTGRGTVATGPCADTTGVEYTVTNHPEATGTNGVTPITSGNQNGGTAIFLTTTGTATAPELVTIVGTKAGCAVKTTNYFASPGLLTANTGNFPVEAGAATWALAVIED